MTTYAVIGYNNLIDSATLAGGGWVAGGGSSWGGGGWVASSTLDNLKTRYLRQYAISDGATTTATQFTIDLGSTQTIGVIALCNHNLTPITGQVTITGADDAGFTEIAWRGNNMQVYSGSDFAVALPADVGARYWKVEILDSSNAAGYVRIGRVFIGPAFAPLQGLEFGSSLAVESRAGVNEAWSGMEFFESRRNRRVWRGQFNHLNETEAHDWINVLRTNDSHKEVYLVDTAARQSGNLIAGALDLSGLTRTSNTAANPLDGTVSAETLNEATNNGVHIAHKYEKWSLTADAAVNSDVTFSIFVSSVSAGRYPALHMSKLSQPNEIRAVFNPSSGLFTSKALGTAQNTGVGIIDAGGGWKRIYVTGKPNWGSGLARYTLWFDNDMDITQASFTGDTGKSMTIWGPMLNYGGLIDYIDAAHPMILDTAGTRGTRSFLGRLRALNPVEWPYVNQYATAVEISEAL